MGAHNFYTLMGTHNFYTLMGTHNFYTLMGPHNFYTVMGAQKFCTLMGAHKYCTRMDAHKFYRLMSVHIVQPLMGAYKYYTPMGAHKFYMLIGAHTFYTLIVGICSCPCSPADEGPSGDQGAAGADRKQLSIMGPEPSGGIRGLKAALDRQCGNDWALAKTGNQEMSGPASWSVCAERPCQSPVLRSALCDCCNVDGRCLCMSFCQAEVAEVFWHCLNTHGYAAHG
jgi:hypothetical protein